MDSPSDSAQTLTPRELKDMCDEQYDGILKTLVLTPYLFPTFALALD